MKDRGDNPLLFWENGDPSTCHSLAGNTCHKPSSPTQNTHAHMHTCAHTEKKNHLTGDISLTVICINKWLWAWWGNTNMTVKTAVHVCVISLHLEQGIPLCFLLFFPPQWDCCVPAENTSLTLSHSERCKSAALYFSTLHLLWIFVISSYWQWRFKYAICIPKRWHSTFSEVHAAS